MNSVNLLILDDKEENIISLSALLSEIEHLNIISCTDPNEALKICWKTDIAIALVDVQMPVIDGFEFVSILKSSPKTEHIIAIMVTAISKEDKYLLRGLESGAVDYLYKPLNPEITIAKVGSFMKQVQAQEEIKQKNIALEESKTQLIRANEDAEEARKSKEIFLANMSHEIRTPINGIIGIIHMLKNSQLSSEQADWISRLETASDSLLLIINDVLDISKIDSGMLRVENEVFSIKNKLADINDIFKLKALSKNLKFEMHIDPNLPELIKGDPLRLQQIINNFVSNSIKFTEHGEISIKAEVTEELEHSVKIKFSVSDTGIGIRTDAVEKIFLAFEQADDSITKQFGGTGLGLAIVKKLAALLNGTIEAKSTLGSGSLFSFEAEFEKAYGAPLSNKIEQKPPSLLYAQRSLRILIAEDNDLNSFMLSHLLESWGCQVDIVTNGRLAVEYTNLHDYDLVMMDTHMPLMSGYEAIREIRKISDPRKANLPILTISASVLDHEQAAAYEAGADCVIGKPFDPTDLHQKISQLIATNRPTS